MATEKGKNIGSKYWMGECIKNQEMKELIDGKLNANLKWEGSGDQEYQLRTRTELFGLNKKELNEIFSFWPTRQPTWDGIAVDGRTLYLFEAKAHPTELHSSCKARKDKEKIMRAMEDVYKDQNMKGNLIAWEKKYYQLANRLTFLYKLKEKIKKGSIHKINKVVLVLLSFANDETHIAISEHALCKAVQDAWREITGKGSYSSDVKHIVIDVKEMK